MPSEEGPVLSKHTQRLFHTLRVARKADPDVPVSTIAALVYIADHQGCSVQDLEGALDVQSSTSSRIVARLPNIGRNDPRSRVPGLGLISIEQDAQDRRKRNLFLTPKGVKLVQEMENALV